MRIFERLNLLLGLYLILNESVFEIFPAKVSLIVFGLSYLVGILYEGLRVHQFPLFLAALIRFGTAIIF